MQTMEKNWAKTAMISLILALTFLIVFDTGIIIADASTGQFSKSTFILGAYDFLTWVQASLALITLISYMILFIFFVLLIREDRE